MHEPGSFCSSKRAEPVVSHSPNIPYALAFKPLRILPLSSHLLSPPPPPNLYCWSSSTLIESSILIENNSPLCAFPVLKPPKSAVSKADGSNEVTPTQPPVSSPSSPATSSSDLLGNFKANYPTKNLFIFCWIREANSPWSCMIPWCDARKRTGTPMVVGTWRQKGCHLWWEPTVVQDSYICSMNHSWRRTCWPQFLYWKKRHYYKVT